MFGRIQKSELRDMEQQKMKVAEQIERTKAEMLRCKPRSHRRMELEVRLRQLMVKQLRFENRIEKRAA